MALPMLALCSGPEVMFSQFVVRPKADRGVVKRMAGCAGGSAWGMFIQRSMLESSSCRTSRLWLDGRVCREATEGQVEFAEAYRVAYVPGGPDRRPRFHRDAIPLRRSD